MGGSVFLIRWKKISWYHICFISRQSNKSGLKISGRANDFGMAIPVEIVVSMEQFPLIDPI